MSTNAQSVTSYASRSISWDDTTLPSGAKFPAGVIFADTVVEERHDDESVITDNPVEIGTVVNDHAFDLPQELEMVYCWDAVKQAKGELGFLESQYRKVLDLKQAKIVLTVVTGKRQYDNLLLKGVSEITDRDTENILMLRLTFRQLIMAVTDTVTLADAAQQSLPQKTMPTVNSGAVSLQPGANYNAGNATGS